LPSPQIEPLSARVRGCQVLVPCQDVMRIEVSGYQDELWTATAAQRRRLPAALDIRRNLLRTAHGHSSRS